MSARASYAEDIETAAGAEAVQVVTIGRNDYQFDDEVFGERDPRRIDAHWLGRPLPWALARPLLDYPYDSGFGAVDVHPVWAWTHSRVIYVHEYDGATELRSAPRDPLSGDPGAEVATA